MLLGIQHSRSPAQRTFEVLLHRKRSPSVRATDPISNHSQSSGKDQRTVNANWRTVVSILVDCLASRCVGRALTTHAAMAPATIEGTFIVKDEGSCNSG